MKPCKKALIAVLLAALLPRHVPAQVQGDGLADVMERAAQYVALYEEKQLGNLLVAEDYLQSAIWYGSGNRAFVASRQQRRTQSDFLILLFGDVRIGLRKVNRVDGVDVKNVESGFESLADDSPEGVRKRIAAAQDESSRYNIGGVLRNINVPTFALKVARRAEASRFSFVKRGTKKIDGIETWEVRFQEQRSPTLTHGAHGESLLAAGALWIEPGTGRILRTELSVENPYTDPVAKGRIIVEYRQNKALGMLVPSEMDERYETAVALVDCTARYSNYRNFSVDVSSAIGTRPSR